MLDDLIGISATDNFKGGSAQISSESLKLRTYDDGFRPGLVSRIASSAVSYLKPKARTISRLALAGLAGLGIYSLDINLNDLSLTSIGVTEASAAENASAAEPKKSYKDKKQEKCVPKITNNDSSTDEDTTPGSLQSIFVNACDQKDLDVRIVTDLRRVSKIKDEVQTAGSDLVFKFKFNPLYWGFGQQRYERRAELVDSRGNVLDTFPRAKLYGDDRLLEPFLFDINDSGKRRYKASKVAFNIKTGSNYLLPKTTGSSVPFSIRNVPANVFPGFGVSFGETNLSLAAKFSGRYVNDETWYAGAYLSTGAGSYRDGVLAFDAGLVGGWQFTADTVRRVKFGIGGKIGFTNNAFAFGEGSSMSGLDLGIILFGDELSNGPFKKPFDDIEYQLMFGAILSNFDDTGATPSTELYLNANLEAFFDFSKVGSSHLLGLVLNGHYVPYIMAGNVPEDFSSDRQATYTLSFGLKSRLEFEKLNHTRFDLKLIYSVGKDEFNGVSHVPMLILNVEY